MAVNLHHGSTTNQHSSESRSRPEQPWFSLPPYPRLIMEAIESINDKYGCNRTRIEKHIESTQQIMPPSQSTLINYHLKRMKNSGQLLLVRNNYMKPGSDPPPKRGRGRPPKEKTLADSPASTVPADPPRSRGRPPKPRDPSIQPKEQITSGSGRPRGRPRKKPITESETVSEGAVPAPEPAAQSTGVCHVMSNLDLSEV
ncbi:unnamed protein product [Thlaspi arvense]|uniref:H15 domain-containing protein n=1 Tax=Thlaspi arvense TaxID=13288 RepID=A0AAU9RG94_THLAR|nr:unnamed protein product [Thlaspi arvense]